MPGGAPNGPGGSVECQIAGSDFGGSFCGVDGTGTLSCWQADIAVPLAVPTSKPIAKLDSVEVGVTVSGSAYGFAGAVYLGEVPGSGNITEISGEAINPQTSLFCSIIGGSVVCNGNNLYGELGNGTLTASALPVTVLDLAGITQVSANADARIVCAVTGSGNLYCWGRNDGQLLGTGDGLPHLTPKQVTGVSPISQVSVGSGSVCAVATGGLLYCWGVVDRDALGNDILAATPQAVVPAISNAVQVCMSGTYGCSLLSDGTVDCWDYPSDWQKVQGLQNIKSVACSGTSYCALAKDGTMTCFHVDHMARDLAVQLPVRLAGCR